METQHLLLQQQTHLLKVNRLASPIYIDIPRKTKKAKRFYLNLNTYRNASFFLLNQTKILYKECMKSQIEKLPKFEYLEIEYVLYISSKRRCDIANYCSVVDKYFCDALTEYGIIPDDDYKHLQKVTYRFGGFDNTPHIDIFIKELDNANYI